MSASRVGLARAVALAVGLAVLATAAIAPTAGAAAAKTKRASVKTGGGQSNGESSFAPAIDGSGRFVVFRSSASDLVGGDTNAADDIFIRNFRSGKTGRVSVGSGNKQANAGSAQPAISADGRFVAFRTAAKNLDSNDTNGVFDIYVRDRKRAKTRIASRSSAGVVSNSGSFEPAISANGRFVAFYSVGDNLVPNDTNSSTDVFVHDRVKRKTKRVSVRSNGAQADDSSGSPSISGDGRFIAFASEATNLVNGDTNNADDVFVFDRKTRKTRRVSVRSNGTQAEGKSFDPVISANGRFVAFQSFAGNLVFGDSNGVADVFIHDRKTRKTKRVSVSNRGKQGNGSSTNPTISADGRYVAFESSASNLVKGDDNGSADGFIRDLLRRKTKRVTLRNNGKQSEFGGSFPALSGDGRFAAFLSSSTDLVPGDSNGKADTFRRGSLR